MGNVYFDKFSRVWSRGIILIILCLSLLGFSAFTSSLHAQCTHTIELTDTYGDGWNGGAVSVSVNGVTVLNNITFSSGSGPVTFLFTASSSQTIRVWRTSSGSYPSEMRIRVLDNSGSVVINTVSPTTGSATSGGHTGTGSCVALSPGACTHSIELTDTWGDGWNGGTVSVSVNGATVLSNITLSSGSGPATFSFMASSGQTIRVWRTASGSYPSEMRIRVLNNASGIVINTVAPTTGSATSGGHTGSGNCAVVFNPCASIPTISCGTATNNVSASGTGAWNNYGGLYSVPGQERIFTFTPTITGLHTAEVLGISGGYVDFFYKPVSGGCNSSGWTYVDDMVSIGQTAAFNLTAGVPYYIMWDPEGTSSYTVNFRMNCPSAPSYDPCTTIPTISCGVATNNVSASGTGAWNNYGGLYSVPGQEKIFIFTPSATGTYQLEVLGLSGGYVDFFYKTASGGCNTSGWTFIDDVISTGLMNSVTLTGGVPYYIMWDPEGTGSYSVDFRVNCAPSNPTLVSASSNPICLGQSTTLSASGASGTVYWFAGSCGTSGQIGTGNTITVSPATTTTYYARNFNNGLFSPGCASFTVTVNSAATPTIAAAGLTTFCQGSSVSINASGGSNYLWNTGATGSAITVSSTGSYSVQSVANSCTSAVSNVISVSVNASPSAPVLSANGPTVFCQGGSVILQSSYAVGNAWSGGLGNGNSATATSSGNYTATYTDANGCTSAVSNVISVTVNPTPAAPVISPSGAVGICQGSSLQLSSSYGSGNTWSSGGSGSNESVSSAGSYSVIHTDANGCVSPPSAAVTVSVNPLPAAPVVSVGGPTLFCAGNSVSLTSSYSSGNTWNTGATGATLSATQTGAYLVTHTDANGCTSPNSVPVLVTVNPLPASPVLSASGPTTFCSGDSVLLSSNYSSGLTWSTGATSAVLTAQVQDTYTATYTDGNGCTSVPSPGVSVTVNPNPVAGVLSVSTACEGQLTQFQQNASVSGVNGSVISQYQWTLGDGTTSSTNAPSHAYGAAGAYPVQLQVTSNYGCIDISTSQALVHPRPQILSAQSGTVCEGVALNFSQTSQVSNVNGAQLSQYTWLYGDGNSAPGSSSVYTYAAAGTYTSSLVVQSNHGCADTFSFVSVVNPVPQITGIQSSAVCEGNQTQLTQMSLLSGVNGAQLSQYQWVLGDGNTAVGSSVGHVYAGAGTYAVQLFVGTNQGCSDTAVSVVSVNPNPVISQLNVPSVCLGQPTLMGQTSQVANINGASLSQHSWTLGDGNQSSQSGLSHSYAAAGSYPVTYVVSTNHGCSATATGAALVNPNPQIQVVSGGTVCEGSALTFSQLSSVSNENGAQLSVFDWTYGDGNVGQGSAATHTYSIAGTYPVLFQVTTNHGCVATSSTIAVVNPSPQLSNFTGLDVCEGGTHQFQTQLSLSGVNGATLQSLLWNFGDGNSNSSGNLQVQHQYSQAGSYGVSILAQSNHGCSDTLYHQAFVHEIPVITQLQGLSSCEGVGNVFSAQGSVLGINNAQVSNVIWDFGDGNTGQGSSTQHTYANWGSYTYTAQVSTQFGCSASQSGVVQVHASPVSDFIGPTHCYGEDVQFTNLSGLVQGSIVGYHWDFGDFGGNSTMMHPNYMYTQPGTYMVRLESVSDMGCRDTVVHALTVMSAPVTQFSAQLVSPFMVQFIPQQQDTSLSYQWSFGDGSSSNQMQPSKTYNQPGGYTVCLLISGPDCSSETCTFFQLNTMGGLDEWTEETPGLSVYPNPTHGPGVLRVTLPAGAKVGYGLRDISGRLLAEVPAEETNPGTQVYDLQMWMEPLPAGVYLLEVKMGTETQVIRWVKSPK